MDVRIEHASWDDPRAVALRDAMDVEMTARYSSRPSADPEGVTRALTVDPATVAYTLLAIEADGTPIAHAAVRMHGEEWELKRVVVSEAARGRGVGAALVKTAQALAAEGGARRMILQTGDRQPEAVRLYERLGWTPIPVYPPYDVMPFSLCFELVFDADR